MAQSRLPWARSRLRRRGLTLIELLIVLAVVIVLVAVPFPFFARKRDEARRVSCQSNLKQIGLGLLQYCRDYDEKFPRATNGPLVWQQAVQPYIKSVAVFICPSNKDSSTQPPVSRPRGGWPEIPRSYALNVRVSKDSLGKIAGPADFSRKIMVAESRASWPDYGSPWWKGRGWSQGFAEHLSTSNYLFVDGHAKAMRPRDTAAPFNMSGGVEGGACPSVSLSCNVPEPMISSGLAAL